MSNQQLSKHFKLNEFTKSYTAIQYKLKNEPDKESYDNLVRLCNEYLEPIRELIGKPLIINSGFRSKEINYRIGGVPNSAHLFGRACDFYVEGKNTEDIYNLIIKNCENGTLKKFDQLIYYEREKFIHFGIADLNKESRFNFFKK